MSTLTVTNINTANAGTDLTVKTGNNIGSAIVISANGTGIALQVSSGSNTVTINTNSMAVGANVITNTTSFTVGNSTINTIHSATNITVGANSYINSSAVYVGNATVNSVMTSNNLTTNSVNVTTLTVATINANGTVGTANQVLTSNGTTTYWATAVTAKNYALTGYLPKTNFVSSTTYFFGSQPQSGLITTSGVNKVFVPASGTLTSAYLVAYNPGPVTGTAEAVPIYIRVNNTTDYLFANITLNMVSNTANSFSNTALSIAVNAGDYFEFKQVDPAWATTPTNIMYAWTAYIT